MRIAPSNALFSGVLPQSLNPNKQPLFSAAPAVDTFTPLFAGSKKDAVREENLRAVQNTLAQEDIDALLDYYAKAREAGVVYKTDANGIRVETTNVEGWVKIKDGKIVKTGWLDPGGAPVSDDVKAIFQRQLEAMTDTVHGEIAEIDDGMYGTVAVAQEYTFKPGYAKEETLPWHGGAFLRYHGIMGVHVDPRIHGAQLEVRDTADADKPVETRPTKPNQMLVFHNVNTEHRVSGVRVDETDPDKPAVRNVVTVGIQARPYSGPPRD